MGDVPTVGIVGLGHIGGSLALALRDAGVPVVATSRSQATRDEAGADGVAVVDDVAAVVERADVVVVAAALGSLHDVLGAVGAAAERSDRSPTLTDVGSVKAPVQRWAGAGGLADPSTFVAGHPMAGNEGSGWSSATPDLFDGRTWALGVEAGVPLTRWAAVAEVALAVGSQVVPLDAQEHDDAVALVSHLPYALAALAAGAVDDDPHPALARSLAAGSFASLTRVAGGHATLGAAMALGNRAAVARRARTFARSLDLMADALEGDDDAEVEAVFAAGLRAHALLDAASGAPQRVPLDRDGLLSLGRDGGRVVAVHAATADEVEVDLVAPEVVA